MRIGGVDDVFHACSAEMHVEYPTPVQVIGVWTGWFQLLDCIQEFQGGMTSNAWGEQSGLSIADSLSAFNLVVFGGERCGR